MNLRFNISDSNDHIAVTRPIIDYNKMQILFDTGASIPVWCTGYEDFCDAFPNARKQNFKYFLSGFGRTRQEVKDFIQHPTSVKAKEFLADVYSIPEFRLSVEEEHVTWKNLNVAITEKEEIGVELILPSAMFRGMELRWNQEDIRDVYIEVRSQTDMKYVFVKRYPDEYFGKELLKYIYAQDDAEQETAALT